MLTIVFELDSDKTGKSLKEKEYTREIPCFGLQLTAFLFQIFMRLKHGSSYRR